jgi:hypothetical protein
MNSLISKPAKVEDVREATQNVVFSWTKSNMEIEISICNKKSKFTKIRFTINTNLQLSTIISINKLEISNKNSQLIYFLINKFIKLEKCNNNYFILFVNLM